MSGSAVSGSAVSGAETGGLDAALRANVESQLERLLAQLEDLEELKEDLSEEECVEWPQMASECLLIAS